MLARHWVAGGGGIGVREGEEGEDEVRVFMEGFAGWCSVFMLYGYRDRSVEICRANAGFMHGRTFIHDEGVK